MYNGILQPAPVANILLCSLSWLMVCDQISRERLVLQHGHNSKRPNNTAQQTLSRSAEDYYSTISSSRAVRSVDMAARHPHSTAHMGL
jgi:hypothetical protein